MNFSCMLTTMDNPYDPYTQFNEWFAFDFEHGYNTCGYLARIAKTNSEMTSREVDAEVERAIDEIISNDVAGIYKKVMVSLDEVVD